MYTVASRYRITHCRAQVAEVTFTNADLGPADPYMKLRQPGEDCGSKALYILYASK